MPGSAPRFFGLCNASVRFAGDLIRARIGDLPLILASLALATFGFVLIGTSPYFALSVAAFAITGFGTACIIPSIFAIAALEMPDRRAAAIGIVSLVAGLPRALAPWAFGWIAGAQSTSFAFGLCAVAMVAAFAIVVMLNRCATRHRSGAVLITSGRTFSDRAPIPPGRGSCLAGTSRPCRSSSPSPFQMSRARASAAPP